MSSFDWARLGDLIVPSSAAEAAQRDGRAMQIYPSGMEALASYQPVAANSNASAMRGRLAQSGVEPSAGVIEDLDHNATLPPRVWRGADTQVGVVDQMVREDPVAKAIKLAWTLPVVRSAWTVEPNGDDAKALEIAEFVRANFWEYAQNGFQEFIEHAVSMVWRGFALSEIIVKFDRDSKQTVLAQLAPILPRTVDGWLRYEGEGWGVQQYQYMGDPLAGSRPAPGELSVPNLAPGKLLHFTWDPDADAPEGTSILRPCYAGWRQRRLYLKLEAAGYERGAFGIPYVEIDPAARQGDSSTVNEILRELRTGSRAWATLPPGYTLKFADFPMKGTEIREARIAAGQDMARSALATFLFTGEKAGAFSLIKGQQDFFQMALQTAADSIAAVLSTGANCLIKRLVSWNFQNVDQFPKLTPGSISIGDPVGLVNAVKVAAEAGTLTPGEDLEESIRSALGLPEMPDETAEQWRARITSSDIDIVSSDGSEPKANTALNGAQVAAAVEIVNSVNRGELSRESGLSMIVAFFGLSREDAESVMGDGEVLVAPPEESPAPAEPPAVASPEADEVVEEDRDEAEAEGEEIAALAEKLPVSNYYEKMVGAPTTAKSGRPLRAEERMVRLDETLAPMVAAKQAMADLVKVWRDESAEKYATQVAEVASNDITKISSIKFPNQGTLVGFLTAVLRKVYRAGQQSIEYEVDRISSDDELANAIAEGDAQVTREGIEIEAFSEPHTGCCGDGDVPRQGLSWLHGLSHRKPRATSPEALLLVAKGRKVKAPKPVAPGDSVADEIDPEEAVEKVAVNTAIAGANRIESAAIVATQAASIGGVISKAAAKIAVKAAVDSLSTGPDLIQAQRDANTIFGLGRLQQARAEDIEYGIYSTMLESDTCAACAALDQRRFPMEDADQFATPNPDCYGGDLCNCLLLFVPK